ncbi:MAG TPA: MFS transporter, partial [Nocardioides sp.]
MSTTTQPAGEVGADPSTATPRERRRTIFGIGAGNAMEWFDWNIYATFAVFFAGQFFDNENEVSALLSTLAVFAVGFAARPLGGLFFGWLADQHGRKASMAATVALAAGGSLVIGLAPTYTQIGVWASVILLVARLGQGLAHGGELPSAQTYVSEVAPVERRGLWASLIYFSGTVGVLAGTLIGAVLTGVLTEDQMYAYGWRIPFVLGGVFGLYSLVMRLRMNESEVFCDQEAHDEAAPEQESRWSIIKKHPKLLFQVIGMVVGGTVAYYVWAVAAPAYAISVRGIDPEGALWAGVGANLVFLAALPLAGRLSDKVGRKPMMLTMLVGLAVLTFPLNAMVGSSPWSLFAAMTIALIFMACFVSIAPAAWAEIFPTRIRTVGLGVPYSIAVAAFGGTAPYLQTWFAGQGNPNGFLWYSVALLVISALTVL